MTKLQWKRLKNTWDDGKPLGDVASTVDLMLYIFWLQGRIIELEKEPGISRQGLFND